MIAKKRVAPKTSSFIQLQLPLPEPQPRTNRPGILSLTDALLSTELSDAEKNSDDE